MKQLHDKRAPDNMVVWYSLVARNGKATPDDIMTPPQPRAGEWYRQGGPDKFLAPLASRADARKPASGRP
jgi:hypothetical protein